MTDQQDGEKDAGGRRKGDTELKPQTGTLSSCLLKTRVLMAHEAESQPIKTVDSGIGTSTFSSIGVAQAHLRFVHLAAERHLSSAFMVIRVSAVPARPNIHSLARGAGRTPPQKRRSHGSSSKTARREPKFPCRAIARAAPPRSP
jgi:hypothetical protein